MSEENLKEALRLSEANAARLRKALEHVRGVFEDACRQRYMPDLVLGLSFIESALASTPPPADKTASLRKDLDWTTTELEGAKACLKSQQRMLASLRAQVERLCYELRRAAEALEAAASCGYLPDTHMKTLRADAESAFTAAKSALSAPPAAPKPHTHVDACPHGLWPIDSCIVCAPKPDAEEHPEGCECRPCVLARRPKPDAEEKCARCGKPFGGDTESLMKMDDPRRADFCWRGFGVQCVASPIPAAPDVTPKVGDVVVAIRPMVLRCGSGEYPHAVVVSTEPFVLVSESTDMLWSATVKPEQFRVTGEAGTYTLGRCMGRLVRDLRDGEAQLRAEVERLRAVIDAWVDAAHAATPGDHSPEALKRRVASLTEQADGQVAAITEANALRAELDKAKADCERVTVERENLFVAIDTAKRDLARVTAAYDEQKSAVARLNIERDAIAEKVRERCVLEVSAMDTLNGSESEARSRAIRLLRATDLTTLEKP